MNVLVRSVFRKYSIWGAGKRTKVDGETDKVTVLDWVEDMKEICIPSGSNEFEIDEIRYTLYEIQNAKAVITDTEINGAALIQMDLCQIECLTTIVQQTFDCSNNPNLTKANIPQKIGEHLCVTDTQLTDFYGVEIKETFYCRANNLKPTRTPKSANEIMVVEEGPILAAFGTKCNTIGFADKLYEGATEEFVRQHDTIFRSKLYLVQSGHKTIACFAKVQVAG